MVRMRKLFFAFRDENKGNVGMLFGLLILPMVATVGMAIDYGQAISAHQKLQTLVDKAAIAGARLPATTSANRIEAATEFFQDNLEHSGLTGITPVFKGNNTEVSVSAKYAQPTAIMKLFGHTEFQLSAMAVARPQVDNGGIVYAPQWRINISGNGATNQDSPCFAMIADHFYLEGNGQFHVRSTCQEAGLPELMPKIKAGPQLML